MFLNPGELGSLAPIVEVMLHEAFALVRCVLIVPLLKKYNYLTAKLIIKQPKKYGYSD